MKYRYLIGALLLSLVAAYLTFPNNALTEQIEEGWAASVKTVFGGFAFAQEDNITRVLCFGDSLTRLGSNNSTSYCDFLAGARPDLVVEIAGLNAEGTKAGYRRLRNNYLKKHPKQYYDQVILLEGTNDPFPHGGDIDNPVRTGKNLRRMARKSLRYGVDRAYILTIPPGGVDNPDVDLVGYTGEVSEWLLKNGNRSYKKKIFVLDLRAHVLDVWVPLYTLQDKLHPNLAGRQVMAEFVEGFIPR